MRIDDFERRLATTSMVGLDLLVVYGMLTFQSQTVSVHQTLGRIAARVPLARRCENLGLGMVDALPGLFTVALIFLITRFLVRGIGALVQRGRAGTRYGPLDIPGDGPAHAPAADGARCGCLRSSWPIPYLPGSQTEAFKGVSVFLGLMVTLGSSGLVSQIMSGFTITYSRALRLGDFVRIGDVEGTVNHLGVLSTKLKTAVQ